ncbi:MAG: hypothetical protein IJX89_02945 [Alphaproteobacteria bacterium]|nr:hypothetical protein [Alphaproteobacteria bacterium]
MKIFLSVCLCLFTINGYAIEMDDFTYWYPGVVGDVLRSDILPSEAKDCFYKYRENVWKPAAGYSAYEFGYNCMYALLQCNLSMDEESIYNRCAELSVRLIKEQEKYLDLCKTNPEYTVCAPVIGESCTPDGAFHIVEHKNAYTGEKYEIEVSTEKIICKNGTWQKMEKDSHTIRKINLQELQENLYLRCVNHQLIQALGGEKDLYFDCDVESRKCLIAQEADSESPTTWWFCCKLFNNGEVAMYDGSKGTDGKIKDLKKHLKMNKLCSSPQWIED